MTEGNRRKGFCPCTVVLLGIDVHVVIRAAADEKGISGWKPGDAVECIVNLNHLLRRRRIDRGVEDEHIFIRLLGYISPVRTPVPVETACQDKERPAVRTQRCAHRLASNKVRARWQAGIQCLECRAVRGDRGDVGSGRLENWAVEDLLLARLESRARALIEPLTARGPAKRQTKANYDTSL